MELRNKSVKRENKNKAEKPKPVHSKKAPLVASLVVAVGLATGACSAKDEKPVDNKKGSTVAEKPKPDVLDVLLNEVGFPENTLRSKTVARTVKVGDVIPYIEEDIENGEPVAVSLKVTKITEKEVELVWEAETVFEEGYFAQPVILPYGESVRMSEDILAPKLTAIKSGDLEDAMITVETYVVSKSEKPETKKVEVFMSEIEVPVETKTLTKTVKKGDTLSVFEAGPASVSLKIADVNEKGVGLTCEVETLFEQAENFEYPVLVPYGKTVRLGESATEVKAEKGKNPGEAVVTVKYPDFSE